MCCNWMVGSKVMSSGGNHAPLTEHMKLKIRRDLGRWSRKLLLCLGLENLGKHIVGDAKWEKLYDGCAGSSAATADQDESGPPDFEPDKTPEVSPPVRNRKGNTPTRTVLQPEETEVDDEEDDEEILEKNEEDGPQPSLSPAPEGEENEDGEVAGELHERKEENGEMNIMNDDGNDDEPMQESRSPIQDDKIRQDDDDSAKLGEVKEEDREEPIEENDEEINYDRQSCSTPNSQAGGGMPGDAESMDSPVPSEAAAGEEKGGGALVDNLFQILPYWYFLNRAFGLGGGEGEEGGPAGANPLYHPTNSEGVDEDEDEGGSNEGGAGGRRSSSPQQSNSNSNPRLNSLFLLESLRQQLQGQGGQLAQPNEQFLQQGIQLSDILNRMSGGGAGNGAGANNAPPNIPWRAERGSIPSQSMEGHPGISAAPVDLEADDQPLDLTSGPSKGKKEEGGVGGMNKVGFRRVGDYNAVAGRMENSDIQSPFMLDEQTSKVFRSNPRSSKGYTAQELQAALHDIQSGKLGTRRAAVIYGIPRSTLRNKVYKLGKDRGRLFSAQNGPNSGAGLHNNNNNNNSSVNHNNNIQGKDLAGASGSLLGKLSYLQGLNASNYLTAHNTRAAATRLSTGIGGGGGEETEEATTGYLKHLRKPPTLYPMNNGGGGGSVGDGKGSPPKLRPKSSLSELISKHAQQQRGPQQQLQHHQYQNAGDMGMDVDDSYQSGDNEPHIPTSLLSQSDWKSAISRHEHLLNHHQHQQQRDEMQAMSNHRQQQQHHHHHLQQQVDDGANSLDLAGKKSRPKRGKYRNYDREALIKAVRAVQNGEMSVHRAGSFFGVPHSTLEYKVKERHLLRRPKRKEVTSPISQTKSSSPESSSDATPISVQSRQPAYPQSSFYSKGQGKNLPNNVSGGSSGSGGVGREGGSSYLFPLTSDLRESLSRYLNSEQQESRGGGSDSHSEMEVGASSGQAQNDDDEQLLIRRSSSRKQATTEDDEPRAGPFALEGLIGSRLSSLFQLNDMLIRSSGGEGGGGEARENLLDLTKK